jgi:DNA-binding LytR/AlgR family response regulator
MEDHYVRVHTASGSHLVLATFGQAQAALEGAPGLRVHRSWWVADRAVAAAERDGRNLRLVLANGLTAPVARSSVAEVRAKGWLNGEA